VATVFGLIYSVVITYKLDSYKNDLEKEVEEKSRALSEHHEKMISIQNNTIIGMANLIENRDGDTGGHVKRTSSYVGMLARAAQNKGYCADVLTDDYIEMLTKAAPMHDIGKIAIPDSILKKPGRLTPQEFECIKTHAAEGGRIVEEVLDGIEEKEYVEIAKEVASGHHEKWDGSGYPLGLKADNIPISARIMAIADVFDALVSKRCYKEAMTYTQAFEEIKRCAGTHFDPVLAALFVEIQDEVKTAT
jgi:response regulator RpfG family c-di-GMP phosphodiesterase